MTGFVSFVGSGPGDPELLTLKAVTRLQRADVVLFDDLSSGAVLGHARVGAELVAVGKRADLALWTGDPLEVSSVALQVWFDGTAIPMRSRQTELRDRYLRSQTDPSQGGLPRAYPRR